MKSYRSFIFDSYVFNERTGVVQLNYSLDDEIRFTETLELPAGMDIENIDTAALDRSLFALHLIGGISYYKTCLPKKIEIRSGSLNEKQAQFWNTVYEKGLGEFFYQNKIDFRGLIKFPSNSETAHGPTNYKRQTTNSPSRLLVPLGGGKDSLVTIELLKQDGLRPLLLRMGDHPLIDELATIAGLPLLSIKRSLSPTLFELNKEGALNGHVPVTAYLSFLSVVLSLTHGFQAVVMSNERSANEGNVEYLGTEINHQWSKGAEFEKLFSEYLTNWITPDVTSFNLLGSLNELTITFLFTQFPQYFEHFSSCNRNWKIISSPLSPRGGERARVRGDASKWCQKCPKCAFVFCCLAAFLPKKKLTQIFGANLYDDASLLPLYRKLLGTEGFKPFECVGTKEETQAAFLLAHERGEWEDTPVMKMFSTEVLPTIANPRELKETMLVTSA